MPHDYRHYIHRTLVGSLDIEDSSGIIDWVNDVLIELAHNGQERLVQRFCCQTKPDLALDILLEAWVGLMLVRDERVTDLEYEPSSESSPPDFRFVIDGVGFDVQVKRLRKVGNQDAVQTLLREMDVHFATLARPWFIDCWISTALRREHVNPFLKHFKKNLSSFEPGIPDDERGGGGYRYYWPDQKQPLIAFCFYVKNSGENGIHLGMFVTGGDDPRYIGEVDLRMIRRRVKNTLKKAATTFPRPVSATQSNLVLLLPTPEVWVDDGKMDEVLYGSHMTALKMSCSGVWNSRQVRAPDGLFGPGRLSKLSAVLLVPARTIPIHNSLTGSYFVNPEHTDCVAHHPKLFEDMM